MRAIKVLCAKQWKICVAVDLPKNLSIRHPDSNGWVFLLLCRTDGLPNADIKSSDIGLKGGATPVGYASPWLISTHKVSKVAKGAAADPDTSFSVEGTDGGTFAIASSKKELKQLMKSNADVVYDERKGKLYFNDNGAKKGWGEKKDGGLVAKFKGKPELSSDYFDGLSAYQADEIICVDITDGFTSFCEGSSDGEDIKDQIALAREGLSDAEESELYGEILINPKKGLKSIRKAAKKEGFVFDKDELADALNEMDQVGAFVSVELDDAALEALLGTGDAFGQRGSIRGC